MKKKHIYSLMAIVLIMSIMVSVSKHVKADEVDKSLGYYEQMYDNTYLGRGYNLLENSISFRDLSAIKTDKDTSIFDYDIDKGLNQIAVKRTDNEVRFEVEKFVCNSKLDYINKYIKAYENGIILAEEDNDNIHNTDWIAGKGDIEFVKETMNQLDMTGNEIVDYSTFIAYANICALEMSQEYSKYVRKEFLHDLFNLDARSVLMKYGTHVLTAVSMGSYIESTYTIISNDRQEMDIIEKFIADYMNNYYSKDDSQINTSLNEDYRDKLCKFLNSEERRVIINRTTIAKLENNKGVKYNGNYEAWQEEVANKPLFIGAAGNCGLVQLSEIIRNIEPTSEYSSEMLREKSEEIAKEYAIYASEVEADKQKELDEKFGKFTNSCVEISATPIAIKEKCGFNKEYALGEEIQALHTGYSLGKLKMYNAVPSSVEGNYKSDESCGLKLMYEVGENLKKLPIGTSEAKSHELGYSPTYLDKFKYFGSGGYYTEAEYNDGLTEILSSGEDIFNKKNAMKALTILNLNDNKFLRAKVEAHGGLKKITVNVLYNTKAKVKDKFFKISQDWLCMYEINFTKD